MPNEVATLIDAASEIAGINFHDGQSEAWLCEARFLLICAGARAGKTSFGSWWLWKQIKRMGPGTYIVAAPTYKLLDKGVVPELEMVFVGLLGLGRIVGGSSGEFRFSEQGHRRMWPGTPYIRTRIVFGHADNPDSLEALTAKGAWLDECGQKQFKQGSWEAVRRRLAIHRGPCLMTTTPYLLDHWIKTDVWDAWERIGTKQERPGDKDFAVVSFESRMNPVFPMDEWYAAEASMPEWRFSLFYRGRFTRPSGLIYDCIDPDVHFVDYEKPPADWKRYVGLDFGAPNFAAVFLAGESGYYEAEGPTLNGEPNYLHTEDGELMPYTRYWAYAEYRPDVSRTAADHVAEMRKIEPGKFEYIVGGSMSEGQWRAEFKAAGFNVREPNQTEVEIGISRTWGLFNQQLLMIMKSCPRLIHELQNYSRPVDDNGDVLEGILDKADWHSNDALRYFGDWAGRKSHGSYVGVV